MSKDSSTQLAPSSLLVSWPVAEKFAHRKNVCGQQNTRGKQSTEMATIPDRDLQGEISKFSKQFRYIKRRHSIRLNQFVDKNMFSY